MTIHRVSRTKAVTNVPEVLEFLEFTRRNVLTALPVDETTAIRDAYNEVCESFDEEPVNTVAEIPDDAFDQFDPLDHTNLTTDRTIDLLLNHAPGEYVHRRREQTRSNDARELLELEDHWLTVPDS